MPAMGRGRKAVLWFGLSVGAVAFAVMGFGGAFGGAVAWHRVPGETATTTGTVVTAGHCGGRSSQDGTARFTVAGEPYNANVPCNARSGAQVSVKYDPASPSHNNDSHGRAIVLFVVSACGFVLLVSIVAVIISLRRTPTLKR